MPNNPKEGCWCWSQSKGWRCPRAAARENRTCSRRKKHRQFPLSLGVLFHLASQTTGWCCPRTGEFPHSAHWPPWQTVFSGSALPDTPRNYDLLVCYAFHKSLKLTPQIYHPLVQVRVTKQGHTLLSREVLTGHKIVDRQYTHSPSPIFLAYSS
jgi:hypothetical protein